MDCSGHINRVFVNVDKPIVDESSLFETEIAIGSNDGVKLRCSQHILPVYINREYINDDSDIYFKRQKFTQYPNKPTLKEVKQELRESFWNYHCEFNSLNDLIRHAPFYSKRILKRYFTCRNRNQFVCSYQYAFNSMRSCNAFFADYVNDVTRDVLDPLLEEIISEIGVNSSDSYGNCLAQLRLGEKDFLLHPGGTCNHHLLYSNVSSESGCIMYSKRIPIRLDEIKEINVQNVDKSGIVAVRGNYNVILFNVASETDDNILYPMKGFNVESKSHFCRIDPFFCQKVQICKDNGKLNEIDIETGKVTYNLDLCEIFDTNGFYRALNTYVPTNHVFISKNMAVVKDTRESSPYQMKLLDSYLQEKKEVLTPAVSETFYTQNNTFIFAAASNRSILLMDLRQPGIPMASIDHYLMSSPTMMHNNERIYSSQNGRIYDTMFLSCKDPNKIILTNLIGNNIKELNSPSFYNICKKLYQASVPTNAYRYKYLYDNYDMFEDEKLSRLDSNNIGIATIPTDFGARLFTLNKYGDLFLQNLINSSHININEIPEENTKIIWEEYLSCSTAKFIESSSDKCYNKSGLFTSFYMIYKKGLNKKVANLQNLKFPKKSYKKPVIDENCIQNIVESSEFGKRLLDSWGKDIDEDIPANDFPVATSTQIPNEDNPKEESIELTKFEDLFSLLKN